MSIKRIFIAMTAIFAASAVFADNSSVTSKKYVDDLMSGYQGKLPGSGANKLMIYDDETGIGEKSIETTLGESATGVPTVGAVKTGLDGKQDTITGTAGYVMTGTGTPGDVGERAIYSANTNYSNALVTAETVNTGVINAVNSSLIRVDENGDQDPNGTLWEIQDDLVALNICSNYTNAMGTGVQNGTPTPTNPVLPTFYQDGDMILRAVGNYADSYDANTNKITRHVGVKVLDGTEGGWSKTHKSFGNSSFFADKKTEKSTLFCSRFQYNDGTTSSIPDTCCGSASASKMVYFRYDNLSTVEDWKQYLADQYANGTPVVVYYPLETPVEESMPPRCQ